MMLRRSEEDSAPPKLEKLGFSYELLKQWRKLIAARSGMIVVAGPSGSGKRSVLYSVMHERNTPDTNVCSVEDLIERAIAGATQIPIDVSARLHFPAAVEAALDHEPDVLMVSDFPDGQTASAAARAALGGKLVVGAIAAADCVSAMWRLARLGVDANLLSSTLSAVLARRLVRRLCTHCRDSREATAAERRQFGQAISGPLPLFHPRGCEHCHNTGYDGRIGIHELLVPDDALRECLSRGASLSELREAVARQGVKPLRLDGLEKARNGMSSLEEILRATS